MKKANALLVLLITGLMHAGEYGLTGIFDNKLIDTSALRVLYEQRTPDYTVMQLAVAAQTTCPIRAEAFATNTPCGLHVFKNAIAGIQLLNTYDQLTDCLQSSGICSALVNQLNAYKQLITTLNSTPDTQGYDTYLLLQTILAFVLDLRAQGLTKPMGSPGNITSIEIDYIINTISTIVAPFKTAQLPAGIPFITPATLTALWPESIRPVVESKSLNALNLRYTEDQELAREIKRFRTSVAYRHAFLIGHTRGDLESLEKVTHILALIVDKQPRRATNFIVLESQNQPNIATHRMVRELINILTNTSQYPLPGSWQRLNSKPSPEQAALDTIARQSFLPIIGTKPESMSIITLIKLLDESSSTQTQTTLRQALRYFGFLGRQMGRSYIQIFLNQMGIG